MSIEVDDRALIKIEKRIKRYPKKMQQTVETIVDLNGDRALEDVRDRASGRPGPRIVTGAYVSAFSLQKSRGSFTISNASPQTYRLEYGFVGTDSLGRNYNQPAFPHIRPAQQEAMRLVRKEILQAVKKVWSMS